MEKEKQSATIVPQKTLILDQTEDEILNPDQEQSTSGAIIARGGKCLDWCKSRLSKIKWTDGQKQWVRRVWRIVLQFALVGIAFLAAILYVQDSSVNDDYTFSESELTLEVSACRIVFKSGTNDDVNVHVSSRIRRTFNSTEPVDEYFDETSTTLKMLNPNGELDACDIELTSAAFPDITIICDDLECPIEQDDDRIYFNGKLNITHNNEANGNVYLKQIDVPEIYFNVTGTVSIEKLTSDIGGRVIAQNGDVWIQSMQESEIVWKTAISTAYQFVAPGAYHIQEPVCEGREVTISNSTYDTVDCEGRTAICIAEGCAGDYLLDLTASDGGVYVQLLKDTGKLYSFQSKSWRDLENPVNNIIDLLAKSEIEKVRDEIEGDVVVDQFVMISMAGVNWDIGKWLFVTREAYTQLKPWWLSFFSFGLLLPQPSELEIRLVPWPYIFSKSFEDDDMPIMGPIWNLIFSEFGANPEHFLMWMSASDDYEDDWYKITQDKQGEFEREHQDLDDNIPLLWALIMSFILGIFGVIAGTIFAWFAIGRVSFMFWRKLEHMRTYKKTRQSLDRRNGTEMEQPSEVSDKKTPGKDKIPPPFSLIDLVVVEYQNSRIESFQMFLDIVVKDEKEKQTTTQSIRLLDIKEKYEAYWFVNGYQEKVLKEETKALENAGFTMNTKSDSTTEVFKNIRLKSERELDRDPEAHQIPGEDSLSFFVRTRCVITAFDSDYIFVKEFNIHYEKFNRQLKTQHAVAVTKRAMSTLGANHERLTLNVVTSDGTKKVVLTEIDREIETPTLDPFTKGWYGYDVLAVAMHYCLIGLLLLPITLCIIYSQHLHAIMSVRPNSHFLILTDVLYRPWLIPDKTAHFEWYSWVAVGLIGFCGVLAWQQLTFYYVSRAFPWQPHSLVYTKCILQFSQNLFYAVFYIVCAMVFGQFVIGLCWCILGAVLNPEVFLPYATASVTLIAFTAFKIFSAIKQTQQILGEIIKMLTEKMTFMLKGMLDKVIQNFEDNPFASVGVALASGRYMNILDKTPLGGVVKDLGIDPQMITAIAQGDSAAIKMLTAKFGVDECIIEVIMAAVSRDQQALMDSVPNLANLAGIRIDPELAKTFVSLAWKTNEANLRSAIKAAVVQFTEIMLNKYAPETLEKITPKPASRWNFRQYLKPKKGSQQDLKTRISAINPQTVEALVGLARGDVTRLIVIAREVEKAGLIQDGICDLFDFIILLIKNDQAFISSLVLALEKIADVDLSFVEGIASMVSQNFHSQRVMRRYADKLTDKPFIHFDESIDEFLKNLGLPDSLIVQVVMLLTRKQFGSVQRLLPKLVEYLNDLMKWNLDADLIQSLFTMINGVKLNIHSLSSRWEVDPQIISCLTSMMLCPLMPQSVVEKAVDISGSYLKSSSTAPKDQSETRPLLDLTPREEADEEEEEKSEEETDHPVINKPPPTPEKLTPSGTLDSQGQPQGVISMMPTLEDEIEQIPGYQILNMGIQPSTKTMPWLGKAFKLNAKVIMGLFVAMRGAGTGRGKVIGSLTKEVMRRTRLDVTYADQCSAIVTLVVSIDANDVRAAQEKLNLSYIELAHVAKRFISPKEIPITYMTKKLGFKSTHILVNRRTTLDWATNPQQCLEWCKAVAQSVKSIKKLSAMSKMQIQGQLMIASQVPDLLIKKLMEGFADDNQIEGMKTMLKCRYINTMDGTIRKNVINSLSRLFEVPWENMEYFIDVTLAKTTEDRVKAINSLVAGLVTETNEVERIQTVVADASDQFFTITQNVQKFTNLASLLGLPSVLIQSISPGMIKEILKSPEILLSFITEYATEFGVADPLLSSAIGAFFAGNVKDLEPLGTALGLVEGSLTSALSMFGNTADELMINIAGQILKATGASQEVINNSKAFAALLAEYNQPFTIDQAGKIAKVTAPVVLGECFGIPPLLLEGLLHSIHKDEDAVCTTLVNLCGQHLGKFVMDEAYCRGFCSLAWGTINGIEDICTSVRYDADVADVLVILAGSSVMTHNYLKQSSAFQKIWVTLGFESNKMAAMLALTQNDLQNVEELAEDLDENHAFPAPILKALMSVYFYSTITEDQHNDYDPLTKMNLILQNIKPLSSIFNVDDSHVASFVIGLAQGNAAVLWDMYERFGWSGIERAFYGALVCLVHQSPFISKAPKQTAKSWLAYKELDSICNQIAQLFQLNSNGVEKLVLVARGDNTAWKWMASLLGLKGPCEAKKLIKSIVLDGQVESDYEEQEDELENVDFGQVDLESPMQTAREDSEASLLNSEREIEMQDLLTGNKTSQFEYYVATFKQFVGTLNEQYSNSQTEFTEENVKLLLQLTQGVLHDIDKLESVLTTVYKEEFPINIEIVKELLAITTGDYQKILEMCIPKEDEVLSDSKSIFSRLQLKSAGQATEFLMKLASRDPSWLDMCHEGSEIPIIGTVVKNNKLAKAIFGLCSLDHMTLTQYLPDLAKYLEIDSEMAEILIYLATNSLNSLINGVIPLAERLQVDTAITNSFVAMAHGNTSLRLDAISTLCDRLTDVHTNVVNALFCILRGDAFKGWSLLYQLIIESVDDDRLLLLSAIEQMLCRQWDLNIDIKAFGVHAVTNLQQDKQIKLLAEALGFNTLLPADITLTYIEKLSPELRENLPSLMIDTVVAIAHSNVDLIGPTMHQFGVPKEQYEVLTALTNLFNRDESAVQSATDVIENYIEESKGSCQIPPGLIQALYGGLWHFPDILAKGVGRALQYSGERWGSELCDPAIPQFLVSLVLKQGVQEYEHYQNAALFIIKKFVGVELTQEYVDIFLSLISNDLMMFIRSIANICGLPLEALEGLYMMTTSGNMFKVESLPWVTKQIGEIFELPEDVTNALIMILSSKIENLDVGRKGMGETLHTLVSFIVTKIPLPEVLTKEIEDEQGQRDPAIIKILDAIFLACTNPYKYKENVLAAMPVLGSLLLGDVPEEVFKLLSGVVMLFQSEGNPERLLKAVDYLAVAFGIDQRIVKGFVSLAKGDWAGMADMVARFCEFDPETINTIVQLIKKLRNANEAEVVAPAPEAQSKMYKQLKEKIEAGADANQIFNILDVDCSGKLDFEEFEEVLKYYDWRMSKERQLEIFSRFDEDGSLNLSFQEFNQAMQYQKEMVSNNTMAALGLSRSTIFRGILLLIFILLLMFIFIFLGIMAFTTHTTLGSVVNAMMPATAGGLLGAGSGEKTESKVKQIKPSIEKVFSVLTVGNI